MNRNVSIVIVVCLLALMPMRAYAANEYNTFSFPSCGSVVMRNVSHQFGEFNWLEYIVETHGVFDICGQWLVLVEANVVAVPNSGLTRSGILHASARRQVMVPRYGRYQTNGYHFASLTIPNPFFFTEMWPVGNTASHAEVVAPYQSVDPEYECRLIGGTWTGWECQFPNCPIIVDTGRDGYRLTSVEEGVRFDLNADGTPELVAWTREDSDEAFLALDRNGNGQIDDGSELFGNHTPAYANRADVTTVNGFEALKFAEGPSYGYGHSYADSRIDDRDAVFARLLLWRDLNHNGISEPNELQRVAESALLAIGTDYKNKRRVDRYGNEFRQRGTVVWADGADHVFDVWLRWRD